MFIRMFFETKLGAMRAFRSIPVLEHTAGPIHVGAMKAFRSIPVLEHIAGPIHVGAMKAFRRIPVLEHITGPLPSIHTTRRQCDECSPVYSGA